jgi:hypothetical protein
MDLYPMGKEIAAMMLFYGAERNPAVKPLKAMLAGHVPAGRMSAFRSLPAFARRLRKPRLDLDIVLIAVETPAEMARIEEVRHLLSDLRLVLVLPAHHPEAIAWAHKMTPRFIAYADNGFEQIGAVLGKMLHRPAKRRSV